MKLLINLLALMAIFSTSCSAKPQNDTLIYCSYAKDGAAGLGLDYCELIADPGTTPKVVVVMDENNRFGYPVTKLEYEIDAATVQELADQLAAIHIRRLDGYRYSEPITGGYEYRIRAQYTSGKNVFASWYGHKIKQSALDAYNTISAFFQPWVKKAQEAAAQDHE